MNLKDKLKSLEGPVLVLGASGFIGANLLRQLLAVRSDVVGTFFSGDAWRLKHVASANTMFLNIHDPVSVRMVFNRVQPLTIFDCSSFGAYSFEGDIERIHATNYTALVSVMEAIALMPIVAYVHAGSSSEYGLNAAAPSEADALLPNSHYAVSKVAAAAAIAYYGKIRQLPCVNLRLYSVYGPYEDSSRLIPVLCEAALQHRLPTFASPEVCRDYIHVDDVVEAFADAARLMGSPLAGESINIGTGQPTKLSELAALAVECFELEVAPEYNARFGRHWDTDNWYADISKARQLLQWSPRVPLREGLQQTCQWWKEFLLTAEFASLSKRQDTTDAKRSISAIIACYKDEQSIPIMYERIVRVCVNARLDYEIIFINDHSPDNSSEVIRAISAKDPCVIGITHSRNFGSQAAFRSGMEIASKQAVVLMDGDLQDPPELIAAFVERWRAGADVVFGRRIKREMPFLLEIFYRAFYRLFASISEVPVPRDAGDFSLIDRTVVYWMLQCQERDSFLRGLRAYVGFVQVGVDYVRPERMFGVSTNNWIRNIGWAKKAIFSFSRTPLHVLTTIGGLSSIASFLLIIYAIALKLMIPALIPKGLTFLTLAVMTFGSLTLLGLGLLGEYIGKILEETKSRPPFIRSSIIQHGTIRASMLNG